MTLFDALGAHAGASVGISGVLMTAGALGIAMGIAETERQTRPPPFADNLWFNLGVVFAVLSVILAIAVPHVHLFPRQLGSSGRQRATPRA